MMITMRKTLSPLLMSMCRSRRSAVVVARARTRRQLHAQQQQQQGNNDSTVWSDDGDAATLL
jgi:hypothetical protein